MAKKIYRRNKKEELPLVPKLTEETKPEVQESEANTVPPIDPIYLLSPLERANLLPDYSKTFTREKHLQMVSNAINSDLATIQRISQYAGKNLSIHELQILDMARRSLDQKNEDRHLHQRYMWERVWGKDVQKIEHSGAISQSDAALMEAFGMDSISIEDMEQIAREADESIE